MLFRSHPDVIAVVRSDRDDQEDNAARGDTAELIAPGVNVYPTFRTKQKLCNRIYEGDRICAKPL